jgi:hypothetical protein
MDTSLFGLVAALLYAGCMTLGAFLNLTWLAKIRPTLKHYRRMTYKELLDRIDNVADIK